MDTRIFGALSLVLILTLSSLLISSVNAGSIFSDGFESGDFSAWSSTAGAATVQSSIKHHGTYAAKFEGLDIAWCLDAFAEQSSCNARWYVQFSSLPASNNYVIIGALETTSGNWLGVLVKNNTAGTWQWGFEEAGGWSYINATINTGVWYAVEIEFRSSGTSKLYIDGSSIDSFSDSARNVKSFRIGQYNQVDSLTSYDDCVVVDSSYIGPEPTDTTPPTFGNVSTNTTVAGQPCSFNCLVGDDTNVSSYIFSTNNTGMWINDSAVVFSTFFNESVAWANVTKTLNDAVDNVVSYLWYANDTSNNWSSSDQYYLTHAPSISILSPEKRTYAFTDIPLTFIIHQTASWMGYSLDGQDNVTVVGNTTMIGLSDKLHQVIVYANNTAGDMGSSEQVYFTVKTMEQITFDQTGIGPDTVETVVTIDGTPYNVTDLPVSFNWNLESIHSFAFQSPLVPAANAKKYVWNDTTGLSTQQSDFIVVSSGSGSIVADYKTQYYLTVSSQYDNPMPTSAWFDAGTEITESVTSPSSNTAGTRHVCTGWTGTGSVPPSGSNSSTTFTLNRASNITWNWKTQYNLTVLTEPTGLLITRTESIGGNGRHKQLVV